VGEEVEHLSRPEPTPRSLEQRQEGFDHLVLRTRRPIRDPVRDVPLLGGIPAEDGIHEG